MELLCFTQYLSLLRRVDSLTCLAMSATKPTPLTPLHHEALSSTLNTKESHLIHTKYNFFGNNYNFSSLLPYVTSLPWAYWNYKIHT